MNVTERSVAAQAHPAVAEAVAALERKLGYLPAEDAERVRQACRFAMQAHEGQMRHSGEPYITHPIAVATLVAEWRLDANVVMAALLHDVLEDCGVGKAEIAKRFGASTADLVDGVTKLDKLKFNTREEGQAESFRKMLLVMARDVRVILVKLADRTHNMRTMGYMPRSKWHRISAETLEIYAPLADRLGLHQTYRELQDLAFRHLKPWRYQVLSKAVARARQRRRDLIQKVQGDVERVFSESHLKARVFGRVKPLYSIYKKMAGKRLSFAHVSDLYGVRVILPQVLDCYTALGLLHQLYKPVPGRFKDYIAIPKTNGYQSLHTTLVGPANVNVEFQIRTEAMDVIAESGVAAHWIYKQGGSAALEQQFGSQRLQSLLDIQNESLDSAEFWQDVKVDLFPEAVYVFTPKGQIVSLPRGATIVDFAYTIHSKVGDHTVAAKVNDQQVPLRTELANGDTVEIITSPDAHPNPAWLGFVRTGRARAKIRSHIKALAEDQAQELGAKLLDQALLEEGVKQLPKETLEDAAVWNPLLVFTGNRSRAELMADIGLGKRSARMIAKRLAAHLAKQGIKPDAWLLSQARYTAHEHLSQGAVIVDGSESASIKYATCCHPIPGDAIVGYLGRGEGLVVHTDQCSVARRLQAEEPDRFITLAWADEPVRPFELGIAVTVANGKGVLAAVTSTLTSADTDIVHISMSDDGTQRALELRFVITVKNRAHLDTVLHMLRRTPSVLRAVRSAPTVQRS
ncbi:MAG: bifunctional (p)ppGpp synthetase/guanosine-3',5'-bis(diphosphate) 3'-pyrophosphohydrolase [Burkholderiaceae bacterium]|nr:MAG: bifunctional (p)ppGpp synthetase/guanosine-3',5'-bis(diphosphate) 3'-pyrophosphohydrolase [Burkholderiaceae bacterium]